MAPYWLISIAYCGAWAWTVSTVWRTGWHRICPNLSAWMLASCLQAILTTIGGASPSAAWTLHIWLPAECLVLLAAVASLIEAMPLARGSSVLMGCAVAWPLALALMPRCDNWYSGFLQFREWVWLSIALSLYIGLASLFRRPVRLAPAQYRAWSIWAIVALATTSIGPLVAATGLQWLSTRSVYRAIMILCCARWAMLRPRMLLAKHPYSAALSAEGYRRA